MIWIWHWFFIRIQEINLKNTFSWFCAIAFWSDCLLRSLHYFPWEKMVLWEEIESKIENFLCYVRQFRASCAVFTKQFWKPVNKMQPSSCTCKNNSLYKFVQKSQCPSSYKKKQISKNMWSEINSKHRHKNKRLNCQMIGRTVAPTYVTISP